MTRQTAGTFQEVSMLEETGVERAESATGWCTVSMGAGDVTSRDHRRMDLSNEALHRYLPEGQVAARDSRRI